MSQRHSGYERLERDHYGTPSWVTEALLPYIGRVSAAWEPACGEGKMSGVLARAGIKMATSDIATGIDFLQQPCAPCLFKAHAIITNPPYNLATLFIEHALDLMKPASGIVAMLLRTDFDHARSRRHLFADHPAFARRIALTRRIQWFEGTKGHPSFNHSWFVWDWLHSGPATVAYAPQEAA